MQVPYLETSRGATEWSNTKPKPRLSIEFH
jgi:hypothetical protein